MDFFFADLFSMSLVVLKECKATEKYSTTQTHGASYMGDTNMYSQHRGILDDTFNALCILCTDFTGGLCALTYRLVIKKFVERVASFLVAVEVVYIAEVRSIIPNGKHLRHGAGFDFTLCVVVLRDVKVDEIRILTIPCGTRELPG